MTSVRMRVSLPVDDEGFLRRECPNCEKQFKWLPTSGVPDSAPSQYYCPYCRHPAVPGSWWTREQVEYLSAHVAKRVLEPALKDFKRTIESLNQPGGLIGLKVDYRTAPPKGLAPEPNDMRRVVPPCHPNEPLKIVESWTGEVGCLVCGAAFAP